MSLVIPSNLIKTKYTIGGEFMFTLTQREYKGYYCEFNGKFYVGKEFNINAPELTRISVGNRLNNLFNKAGTYAYNLLSNASLNNNNQPQSYIYDYKSNIRYFIAKILTQPYIIKEVDSTTYKQLQGNALYTTVALFFEGGFNNKELDEAEKKIPGLKNFIDNIYVSPPSDD